MMAKSQQTDPSITTTANRAPKSRALSVTITNDDIARRAYDLYLARGCEHGHDVDDWINAERELRGTTTPPPCDHAAERFAMPHQAMLTRIRAEYLEMPGLRLTLEQARRLCGVERGLCQIGA